MEFFSGFKRENQYLLSKSISDKNYVHNNNN